jgi:hypothetical protein
LERIECELVEDDTEMTEEEVKGMRDEHVVPGIAWLRN